MSKYTVVFRNRSRPRSIEADWYKQLGKFVHFFRRRPDGGGQTVWRLPASEVAEIRGESQ
ncbi:MAG: hypothetical protein ACLFRT_04870 [Actinomycetota bacterium]